MKYLRENLFLLLSSLFLLSACGFHPLYGVNKYQSTGVEEYLAATKIENIPNRDGLYLKNALIDRFYRDGKPENPRYQLDVSPISERSTDLDITRTSDSTRAQLRLDTAITLRDKLSGNIVLQRNIYAIVSYNILASEFSTRVSRQNARDNALTDLANQIEIQLSLYYKSL